MSDNGLTLEWKPCGKNGKATVTAKHAAEVLACETFDTTIPKARAAFATAVCNGRPGIDVAEVEQELLKLAADLASKPDKAEAPADLAALPEIDTSRIIRPERFITPEVSGLAIPSMVPMGDKVAGRWLLHLRWADGKRERRAFCPAIDLPDNGRLWIHPEPSEPGPSTKAGWSADARRKWLASEAAPDPSEVFKRLCERIAYYVDLPTADGPGITATLACWSMLTYGYLAWPAVPYLYIGGPLGSGKSRVLEVLERLVFRPFPTSSITGPTVFRTLHSNGGTLLLDEKEGLKNSNAPDVAEALSILLAGYKRGGTATRLEPVGDSFRVVSFSVYGPKVLACISGLPPALASRCIAMTMFRAGPGSDKPRRRIDGDCRGWQRLRDDLHALALEHGPTWLELPERLEVCPRMSGRDFELWQPILSIASWLDESGAKGLLGVMQEHALATIDAGRDDQTPDQDETLLRLLAEMVRLGERPQPGDILTKAQEAEPVAFKMWTARAVASHLKRYGLTTTKTAGKKRYTQVTAADLERIQTSYGIDLGASDENE